jgi:membrane-associated phospholipid phosphatase
MHSRLQLITVSVPVMAGFCIFSYYYLDIPVAYYSKSLGQHIRYFFNTITYFGDSKWYLTGSGILFVYFRYIRKNARWSDKLLFVFVSIALSGLLADLIKYTLGRYRPKMLFQDGLYGFVLLHADYGMTSFPSGHANTIAALALALYWLFPRYGLLYLCIAVLVSASRVIIDAHFLSDVVVGAYLGIVMTMLTRSYLESKGMKIGPAAPGQVLCDARKSVSEERSDPSAQNTPGAQR